MSTGTAIRIMALFVIAHTVRVCGGITEIDETCTINVHNALLAKDNTFVKRGGHYCDWFSAVIQSKSRERQISGGRENQSGTKIPGNVRKID